MKEPSHVLLASAARESRRSSIRSVWSNDSLAVAPLERPRVVARIERAARYKIAVILAPAGHGKTIALRGFIARQRAPKLWLDASRCTGRDGFIGAFGRALEAAVPPDTLAASLQRCRDSLDPAAAADLLAGCLPAGELLLAVDGLTSAVLDDPAACGLLCELIERSGEHVRWLLAARSSGSLPLASWMAYGALEAPVDAADLALNEDEAHALAATAAACTPDVVDDVFALTGGWAAPFVLALRAGAQPGQLCDLAGRHRMLCDYLSEQIFSGLDVAERAFCLATCVLESIDFPVVMRLCTADARDTLERLRARLLLLPNDAASGFVYHPLFHAFLGHQLRLLGEAAFRSTLLAAATALEGAERYAAALDGFLRAQSAREVERLLSEHGYALLECGETAGVADGIAFLRRRGHGGSPPLLALRGSLEAAAGNGTWAMTLFETALAQARDTNERNRIANWYALELFTRNDPVGAAALERVVPLLENARREAAASPDSEAALAGALGVAYIMLDRMSDASLCIREALASASAQDNPRLQALVYHQAGFFAYACGDAQRASRLAAAATRLAVETHNARLAARSSSVRFSIARGLEDDPQGAYEHLVAMREFAQTAGERYLQCEALAGMLDIEAERGDAERLRETEAQLEAGHEGLDVQTTAVLPVTALTAAWNGDFQLAHDRLARSDADQPTLLRSALRSAEIALYAAAAGRREAALDAAAKAAHLARTTKLRHAEDRRRQVRTLALCAITYVTVGSTPTANGILLELERARREMSSRTRTIVEAARALYLRAEIGAAQPVAAALARLGSAGYGGLARLLEALPSVRLEAPSAIALLTPAEIEVLRVLARGGSSTKAAVVLQRSVNTVNVHVKSIMRKLRCATRYDAIAIAREHGLVD